MDTRGFTLIEVMLATAILALGIAVIARGFSQCAQAVMIASDYRKAAVIGANKMEEWELVGAIGGSIYGPVVEIARSEDYSMKYSLEPLPKGDLYKLKLDISWERLHRRRSLALVTCWR